MKAVKRAKLFGIVSSALLCAAGLGLIFRPSESAEIICLAVGLLSVFFGVSKIIGYFSHDVYSLAFQFDLALGIFAAAVGFVLVFHPGRVLSFLPVIIGLYVLIDGVFKLQTSLDAKRFGLDKWWLILIGAVACITLGVLLMLDSLEAGILLTTFIGVSLLTDGIQNLFNVIYTVKILKKPGAGDRAYIRDYEYKEK